MNSISLAIIYRFLHTSLTGSSMDASKISQLVKKVKSKTKEILKDHKNANLLLDLLKYSQSKHEDVVCACCQSFGKLFSHFISTKGFLNSGKTTVAEADLSKEDQFSSWLKEQYTTACDVLCDHLCHTSSQVRVSALETQVTLLKAEGKDCPHGVSDKLMENIISQLLSVDSDQTELIQRLPSVLGAWEESTELCSKCLSHVRKNFKFMGTHPSDVYLINCWRVIKQLASQDIDDKSKRQLTGVVCEFLKHKMPTSLYREILTGISTVMEKMSTPLRLADFLSESFNIGGAISLMSLHGLFILMHQYNLDYPDFYKKLYSMFEPQIFSAKYRARFFHLADTFLSSTHLPAYLVAAFAKRLARISLHAPASAAHIAVPFILNLISRHPACEKLLHRTEGPTVMDSDPYLLEEADPSKCKALDSCLWELQTLEHHYDPGLSEKAQKKRIAEQDLSSLLENTTDDIITSHAKKIKKEVPVTFEKPNGLVLPSGFVL